MKHLIYIVFDASKLTKVGMTSDLAARMATYRTTNPSCELAATLVVPSREAAREIEHLTHRILHHGQKQGEWFCHSVDTCMTALRDAVQAWNLLMQSRQKIAGWGWRKGVLSPIVQPLISRHTTSPPPVQDDLDRERFDAAIRNLAEKWPLISDAERQRIFEEDPDRFHALREYLNGFLAECDRQQKNGGDAA